MLTGEMGGIPSSGQSDFTEALSNKQADHGDYRKQPVAPLCQGGANCKPMFFSVFQGVTLTHTFLVFEETDKQLVPTSPGKTRGRMRMIGLLLFTWTCLNFFVPQLTVLFTYAGKSSCQNWKSLVPRQVHRPACKCSFPLSTNVEPYKRNSHRRLGSCWPGESLVIPN